MESSITLQILLMMTATVVALHPDIFARFEADNSMYTITKRVPATAEQNKEILASLWHRVITSESNEIPEPTTLSETTIFTTQTVTVPSNFASTAPPTSSTTTTSMISYGFPVHMTSAALSESDTNQSRGYIIFLIVFVIAMLVLFAILSNINSDYFGFGISDKKQEDNEIDIENNGYDPLAVFQLPTYDTDTSPAFYFPGYRKQLSVVREVSQEYDF
ncbi:unnamed protein product [Caenorhabditis brenneri]